MQQTLEDWVPSLGGEDSPGGGHGNPLQCSRLENPRDRGAWQAWLSTAHSWSHGDGLALHPRLDLVPLTIQGAHYLSRAPGCPCVVRVKRACLAISPVLQWFRTAPSNVEGVGSIPWLGSSDPPTTTTCPVAKKPNIKQEQCCIRFDKRQEMSLICSIWKIQVTSECHKKEAYSQV